MSAIGPNSDEEKKKKDIWRENGQNRTGPRLILIFFVPQARTDNTEKWNEGIKSLNGPAASASSVWHLPEPPGFTATVPIDWSRGYMRAGEVICMQLVSVYNLPPIDTRNM